MTNNGFFKLPHSIGHTDYFKWVLNSSDRDVFRTLCDKTLTRNSDYYDEGLLIANSSIIKIALDAGLNYYSTVTSLHKLDKIGAIVTFKLGYCRNKSYLLGFRTTDEFTKAYLLENLINTYEDSVTNAVEIQLNALGRNAAPTIKETDLLCIKKAYRECILQNIKDPAELAHARLPNRRLLYESLFNRTDNYKKSLSKQEITNSLTGRGGFKNDEL